MLGDALLTTLQRLPNVKWMATTLGKRGSVLIERSTARPAEERVLDEVLSSMLQQVSDGASTSRRDSGSNGSSECGCVSPSGVAIR